MLNVEIKKNIGKRGVAQSLPKAYVSWAYYLYVISAFNVIALLVSTLCFKSPIPGLLIIGYILWIIDSMTGWEDAKYMISAMILIGLSALFDIVYI